jgi:hypothetical protein
METIGTTLLPSWMESLVCYPAFYLYDLRTAGYALFCRFHKENTGVGTLLRSFEQRPTEAEVLEVIARQVRDGLTGGGYYSAATSSYQASQRPKVLKVRKDAVTN